MSIAADPAYDTDDVYAAIKNKCDPDVVVAIPLRKDAALSAHYNSDPNKRDHNILFVKQYGKYRWQDYSDYNYRELVETTMFRYKQLIGDKMYSKLISSQKIESRIACNVLNKMCSLGMPKSCRITEAA